MTVAPECMKCKITRRTATCGVKHTYWGVCFSEDVFGNPRLGTFVNPTSSVCVGVVLRVDAVVCYKCMPMMWGIEI